MTLKEFGDRLTTSGIDFRYHHWKRAKSPPFGVFYIESNSNFAADGGVFIKMSNVVVELYTNSKEPERERDIEEILDALELYYDKVETYVESEKLYQVAYSLTLEMG